MFYDKCPWCGKKVKRSDVKRVHKRKTPTSLTFARCRFCNNYYGQSYFTKRSACYLLLSLIWIIVIFITAYPAFILCFYFSMYFIIRGPFLKMTKDETVIKEQKHIFSGNIISINKYIKKYHYYYFVENFGSYKTFFLPSPIEIHSYNKKSGVFTFSFLYNHENNIDYLDKQVTLYNYDGEVMCEIKLSNKQLEQIKTKDA